MDKMKKSNVNLSDRKIVVTRSGGGVKYRFNLATGFNAPETETEEESVGVVEDLDAPRRLTVESQTVRVRPDGTTVVDITVCFDAPTWASEFEYRISAGDNSLEIQ